MAKRCPSKWGAADERGAANYMNAATVANAARLIRSGEVFELGWTLASDIPLFGTRRFSAKGDFELPKQEPAPDAT